MTRVRPGKTPSPNQMDRKLGTPENPEGYASYYLDVDVAPAYPFGYGLSYSAFEYSDLTLSEKEIKPGGTIDASVKIKNTGKYEAAETVQLYVRDLFGSVTRPVKELKGIKKVSLKPGEEKTVSFSLSTDDLKFWDIDMNFVAEPGDFDLWIGGDSATELKTAFKLVE